MTARMQKVMVQSAPTAGDVAAPRHRPIDEDRAIQENGYLLHLGERVQTLRMERRMTRKVLAEAAGISDCYIYELECGRGNISILLLCRVARAMGVPVETLVADPRLNLPYVLGCRTSFR